VSGIERYGAEAERLGKSLHFKDVFGLRVMQLASYHGCKRSRREQEKSPREAGCHRVERGQKSRLRWQLVIKRFSNWFSDEAASQGNIDDGRLKSATCDGTGGRNAGRVTV